MSVDDLVLFPGSLDELNRFSDLEFEIAGIAIAETKGDMFYEVQQNFAERVESEGYDGVVRYSVTRAVDSGTSNSFDRVYIQGVPVVKK